MKRESRATTKWPISEQKHKCPFYTASSKEKLENSRSRLPSLSCSKKHSAAEDTLAILLTPPLHSVIPTFTSIGVHRNVEPCGISDFS